MAWGAAGGPPLDAGVWSLKGLWRGSLILCDWRGWRDGVPSVQADPQEGLLARMSAPAVKNKTIPGTAKPYPLIEQMKLSVIDMVLRRLTNKRPWCMLTVFQNFADKEGLTP